MDTTTPSCRWLTTLVLGTTAATAALGAEATAEPQFPPWDRGALRLGGFVTTLDSSIRFGVDGVGVELDGEELLGLDSSSTVFRADALYRLGANRRHRLDLSYVGFHRSASKTLNESIDLGDETLPAGSAIESSLHTDLFRTSYTYSFFQDERVSLGAGLGVYIAPVEYGIDVTIADETRTLDAREVTLPLPVLSLRGEVKLSRKFCLQGSADAFYLKLDGFSGSLIDVQFGVEYQLTRNVGLGLAYNFFDLDVEAGEDSDYPGIDFDGAVNMKTTGLLLYGKFSF